MWTTWDTQALYCFTNLRAIKAVWEKLCLVFSSNHHNHRMLLLVTQHTTEPCVSPYIPQQTDSHMEGSITGPRDIHHQTESHMLRCLCSASVRASVLILASLGAPHRKWRQYRETWNTEQTSQFIMFKDFYDLTLILWWVDSHHSPSAGSQLIRVRSPVAASESESDIQFIHVLCFLSHLFILSKIKYHPLDIIKAWYRYT